MPTVLEKCCLTDKPLCDSMRADSGEESFKAQVLTANTPKAPLQGSSDGIGESDYKKKARSRKS